MQLGDKNIGWFEPRRGSVMIVKNRLVPPTLSEAHIVYASLSPSCVSLHARTLAWCFASFGISDASIIFFQFLVFFPLSRFLSKFFLVSLWVIFVDNWYFR